VVPPETRGVGYMFQDYALFPHLTVLENVVFGLRNRGSEATRRGLDVLAEANIESLADSYPHELSGGQQQRVALARALAPRPSVILLDEPYAGLDSRLRERIRDQMLHVLKAAGTAALMVTHDAEEAMFMSDNIIVMRDGEVQQTGRPVNLYCQPNSAFVAAPPAPGPIPACHQARFRLISDAPARRQAAAASSCHTLTGQEASQPHRHLRKNSHP
jgi:iron(III) transport system ATP-binding protein